MPLCGGVSRPSRKQWTKTRSTLFCWAMRSRRKQMLDVRMHAAVAEQAHQVQLALAPALHRAEQKIVVEERAGGDGLVDARDVHLHDAAGADIQVPDFAIAHLPLGQADGRPGGVDQRVGKFGEQPVVIGLAREGDGVAFGFGAIAPAVEHGQDDRFRTLGCHISPEPVRVCDEEQFGQSKGARVYKVFARQLNDGGIRGRRSHGDSESHSRRLFQRNSLPDRFKWLGRDRLLQANFRGHRGHAHPGTGRARGPRRAAHRQFDHHARG